MSIVSVGQVPETNPTYNYADHWIFGKNIHLEFKGKDRLIQHRIDGVNWIEGGASISADSSFYYFKGSGQYGKIQSRTFELLPYPYYGFMSSTQGELFIKHFDSPIHYTMVSSADKFEGYSFYSSFIDSSFIDKFIRFPFDGGEKQQAVNHQNGRDIWYANHAQTGDSIYFFLIKKDKMVECPVVSHTGNSYESWAATQGQMKFSPNGTFLAEACFIEPYLLAGYSFNNEYPKLDSLFQLINDDDFQLSPRFFHGLEFSADALKLYFTEGRKFTALPPVTLNQFDLSLKNGDTILASWTNLDTLFNLNNGSLQLAPDGKIYFGIPNQNYLGVINNPNELGTNCDYVRQGLTLDSGGTCLYGLPTFNQSYFHTPAIDFKYEEDCSTNAYQFWGLDTFQGTSFEWKFRDVRNETLDARQGKNVSYSFPQADSSENKYEVTFIASSGSTTDSVTKTLTIRPKLTNDFLGRDTFYCARSPFDSAQDDFTVTLNAPEDMHCIHWDGLEPYSNLAGDTVVGYENFYGHINANTFRTIDTAGVYLARITNKTFCTAWDTLRVTEKPRPSKSVISRNGNALKTSISANAYRWYFNGEIDTLTLQPFYVPTANGYWQVQLISEFGCESELSDSLNVAFASIKPLNPKPLSFKIYPNPSDGNVSIEVPKSGEYRIQVTDLNGKLIYSTTQNLSPRMSSFAAANEFANGTYIITLTDEDGNTGSEKIEVVK